MDLSATAPTDPAVGPHPARALGPSVTAGKGTAVPGEEELPLVDTTVLQALEEELGRSEMPQNFAKDYSALWEQRERRLIDSLDDEDLDVALDAAISLKVSSAMVGGIRLAYLAQLLETAIRQGDLHYGASVLAMISNHGPATVQELEHQYITK